MANISSILKKGFVYLILTLSAFIMVFPFIWMLLGAFKTTSEIIRMPPKFLPSHFSLATLKRHSAWLRSHAIFLIRLS